MAHRPNILALASKISLESLTYTGITYGDPEYRILDPIVDDDMCSVMMRMRLETDFSAEDLAKKTRKSLDFVQTQCDKLVKAGVIRTRVRSGVLCYYYPIWVPGIMEGILSNREQCDAHPELGACFEEYTRIRVGMLAPMLGNGVNFMRVMPVMSAIENDTHKASYDEISTLIEKAWAISVGPCSCRRSRRLMGEGCGHLEEDMCLYLNDNAISFSKNGEHRLITKEEAYEILRRAEDNGLVHEVNQALGFDDGTAICTCCGCSVRRTASAPTSLPEWTRINASPAASAWKTARRTPFVSARSTVSPIRTSPTPTHPTKKSPGIRKATTSITAPPVPTPCPPAPRRARRSVRRMFRCRAT